MIVHVIDIVLLLVLVEGTALAIYSGRTGRGVPLRSLAATLAAGFFIMLALRFALARQSDGLVAACLLGSLVAHVLDLAGRWRHRD